MPKDKNGLLDFTGPFGKLLPEYINYKRAQGYKLQDPILYRLREMDLFFKGKGIKDIIITRALYEEYTTPKCDEKSTTTDKRRSAIRSFAKYLISHGHKNIYAGYDDSRIFKTDFIPYIFTKDEVLEMFQVLEKWCQSEPGYKNDTFRLVMLMYYCCGFRKSEVQNLCLKDVDFRTGKITVLNGKNSISRMVVISASLLDEVQYYKDKYLKDATLDDYFIRSISGRRYSEWMLYSRFHKLLTEANISPRQDGGSQRLHDIRHTFCVRSLEAMQEKGMDIYTSLPLLATYLGHKHITETEYYLRMLEEHFGGILDKMASYTPELFPQYLESKGGESNEE